MSATFGSNRRPIIFGFAASSVSNTTYANRFFPINGGLTSSATESTVQMTFPYAINVTRAVFKYFTNTFGQGNSVASFRDDAADVTGTVLTIPFGSTAEFDSGSINSRIEAGSKIDFRLDTSAHSTGGWVLSHFIIVGLAEISV